MYLWHWWKDLQGSWIIVFERGGDQGRFLGGDHTWRINRLLPSLPFVSVLYVCDTLFPDDPRRQRWNKMPSIAHLDTNFKVKWDAAFLKERPGENCARNSPGKRARKCCPNLLTLREMSSENSYQGNLQNVVTTGAKISLQNPSGTVIPSVLDKSFPFDACNTFVLLCFKTR